MDHNCLFVIFAFLYNFEGNYLVCPQSLYSFSISLRSQAKQIIIRHVRYEPTVMQGGYKCWENIK